MAKAIKISKSGTDVLNISDKDLIFSSDYPLLKIHKQGTGKVTLDGSGQAIAVITHEVGKIPMYFVIGQITTNGFSLEDFLYQYPYAAYLGLGTYGFHIVKPYTDKLEIRWDIPGLTGQEFKYIYYIFEDPITL